MGIEKISKNLKDFYFGIEDKWYGLIDKIDTKIPVHGLVDRIDNVVPSFALFLVIIALIVLAIALPFLTAPTVLFSFKVTDVDDSPIENASVQVFLDGAEIFAGTTNENGESANARIEPGETINVSVSKDGFVEFEEEIEANESTYLYSIILRTLEANTYNILLKDGFGQPIREELSLSFTCRNTNASPPASIITSTGTATVVEPANCNGLIVSVQGEGFDFKSSIELVQTEQTIYLMETVEELANVTIELYYNNSLISENVTVYLYKDNGTVSGIGPVETEISQNGIAFFERPAGEYFAKTSGYGSFAVAESSVFTVVENELTTIRIDLEESVVGSIKVLIVDGVTGGEVEGARVALMRQGEEIDTKTSSDSPLEFPVAQDTTYTVIVDHKAYCLKSVHNITISESVQEIELTPVNEECGGTLETRVLDQSGNPVINATVGLYNSDGFSVGFGTRITDINGVVEFSRVPSGDYKAFAFKENSSGWSDSEHFVQRAAESTVLTVVLIAGDGTIRVKVSDKEGMPVQFAQVAFVDALTNIPIGGGSMPVQDVNGTVELTTRADKKIYIIASKDGFANFTSTIVPVVADSVQFIDAILEKEILQGEVEIEFKGMYRDNKRAKNIGPGEDYEALFELRIPANKNYDSIGMHVRTGDKETMELDKIVLKSINASGNVEIIKATSYGKNNGYAIDSEHISSGNAKWANLKWSAPSTGIVQVKAGIRVKETANLGDQLNLFYRAFGEENGNYKRDPVDLELGEAESVAGKAGLYASAKQEIFQLDIETICDESFCFSASILDEEDGLAYNANESFSGKVFRPYKFTFSVLNNSEFEENSYMDSEIKISNEDNALLLQEYTIYGAQNQKTQAVVQGKTTEWIETGDFLPNNSISGTIDFTPQKSEIGLLTIEARSGQRIRFTKTIAVSIASDNEMNVVVVPEILPSGIENTITITVKDSVTGAEINGALAKAKDRFGTVVDEKTTNSRGVAILSLPSLQPGEKISLIVGKPDYASFEKMLDVNPDVVKVAPSTIGVALNAKTITETQDDFTLENITSFGLAIKEMRLNGQLYGLIDEERVKNWLFTYDGETIGPGNVKELQLATFLSEKGKKLEKAKQLQAELEITTEALGNEWTIIVPVKISIGLGGEVDDPNCFVITKKEWKASTEGNPIEIEFEVQNNCSIGGAAVSLRNISARANWESNQTGTFSIRTPDNSMELRSGYSKTFSGLLGPEEKIPLVLEFSPNGGVNGKGIAAIIFKAENPTEHGAQELSNELMAEIVVVNLIDCISFDKEILRIKPEETDSFSVETNGCGVLNDIRLESEIAVSNENFTLGETDSREIEVLAEKNIPGQYPIKVYAKDSDQVREKLIKTIRVRILASGCIELSRYEFDVFDNPNDQYDGYDTVEVINHCYNKPVTAKVKFDEKDLMGAIEDGLIYGLITGVIGGFMSSDDVSPVTGKPITQKTIETVGEAVKTGTPQSVGISSIQMAQQAARTYGSPTSSNIREEYFILYYPDKTVTGEKSASGHWTINATSNRSQLPTGELPAPRPAPAPTGTFALGSGPTGFTPLFGGGEGFLGGIGKSVLGPPSFLGWGTQGLVIGSAIAYMNQDKGEFDFTTIQDDLVYKQTNLLMPGATLEEDSLVEVPSEDIIVRDLDETSTEPRHDNPQLSTEKRMLGFLNVGGVVQEDPATPLYRILKIEGERLGYETEYELDEEEYPELEVTERNKHVERFRLQFNSFDPMEEKQDLKPIANCQLGNVSGVTGPDAVPKVKFDWSWAAISEDNCDEGNEDYIYCDATQFSIEILKKVQELREFVEFNRPFDCPTSASAVAITEQELIETGGDVGITRIQANRVGTSDVNIVVMSESNNGKIMDAELMVYLKQGGSLVKSCTRQFSIVSKTIESCNLEGVAAGEYTIEAELVPALCEDCENNNAGNDLIEADFFLGETGVAECEPYNTKRLVNFLIAGNYSASQIEEIQKLINFNANLIEDAYTNDFRADFDEFCKTKSFFDCPEYYTGEEGLQRFFSDSERFEFDYSMAPHAALDAGKYAVTINIEYDNDNWQLFVNGQPDAKIVIELTELSTPEPNSPFYYLPFDGLVGIDSENGRQGYGVNFRQTSEETIKINNSAYQPVFTTNIANTTPIFNGWIDAGFSNSFDILNIENRGILLDVQAKSEATSIVLSPSYATPVMMEVDYSTGNDAYGFYSIEIDNSPHTASTRMIPWSGVGTICRDFEDNPVTEAWQETWDIHGGISGNIECAIGTDITDYGVEWCNPIRVGKTFLQSVVFTPQDKTSLMKRTIYSDGMTLYNSGESGNQISLNGVPGMENNSFGTNTIDSLQDIFDLVEENKVCLVGQGSRISNKFFWNPKEVLEEISTQRDMADTECITLN